MLGSVNGLCVVRGALCSLSKPTAVHERQDVLDQVSSSRRNVALSEAWASRPQEWGRDDPADGGRVNYSISEAKNSGTWLCHHVSNAACDESHVHLWRL
jgi:hypothetical protein